MCVCVLVAQFPIHPYPQIGPLLGTSARPGPKDLITCRDCKDCMDWWLNLTSWGTLWWTNILPWKDPPFLMGTSTISMAIFNCYVSSPEGISPKKKRHVHFWSFLLVLPHPHVISVHVFRCFHPITIFFLDKCHNNSTLWKVRPFWGSYLNPVFIIPVMSQRGVLRT